MNKKLNPKINVSYKFYKFEKFLTDLISEIIDVKHKNQCQYCKDISDFYIKKVNWLNKVDLTFEEQSVYLTT